MTPHTAELAPPDEHVDTPAGTVTRRHDADALTHVRASDIEPYIGLRYLSKLFRFMAIILVLLLVAEVITGLVNQGRAAIPTLLGEMSRLIVLAGFVLLFIIAEMVVLILLGRSFSCPPGQKPFFAMPRHLSILISMLGTHSAPFSADSTRRLGKRAKKFQKISDEIVSTTGRSL